MAIGRYTIAEKIKICQEALIAQGEGVSIHKHSDSLEITGTTLRVWLREYKAGILEGEPSVTSENKLLQTIEEDGNGLVDPEESEQLEIVVVFGDNPDVVVKIDDPGYQKHSDQIAAIKERVFSRFQIFIKV